ncbi:hypothetical protein CCH79_00017471 [Gambusia affinis]|uniref:ZP domain-containing protein n=1 Tax=Gambusia affinis TaxID=33528 RepID=A0A315VCL6_GAMAF|nr:hypothetical protein CCH79_00017471 [Gambusia affinis]
MDPAGPQPPPRTTTTTKNNNNNQFPLRKSVQEGRDLGTVVRTDFLDQPVIGAVERHVDTDDLERLGAHPGDVALGLFLVARLRRVVVAQHHLLAAFGFLVVHPAVERLRLLGVDHALALQVELHLLHGRDQADRHVANTRGVVAEVDAERAVAVIHNLPHYQQIQLDGFDVGVKVAPAEQPRRFGESLNFHDGLKLNFYRRRKRGIVEDFGVLDGGPGLEGPEFLEMLLLVSVGLSFRSEESSGSRRTSPSLHIHRSFIQDELRNVITSGAGSVGKLLPLTEKTSDRDVFSVFLTAPSSSLTHTQNEDLWCIDAECCFSSFGSGSEDAEQNQNQNLRVLEVPPGCHSWSDNANNYSRLTGKERGEDMRQMSSGPGIEPATAASRTEGLQAWGALPSTPPEHAPAFLCCIAPLMSSGSGTAQLCIPRTRTKQALSMAVGINPIESILRKKQLVGTGSYRMRMIPYEDEGFHFPFSTNRNIEMEVDEMFYVEVRTEGVDQRQFAAVLDSCWATPVNQPNYPVRWDLITAQCPNPDDGTVEVIQNGVSTVSRFSFRMFTFTNHTQIYLHCNVHLCLLRNNNCRAHCYPGHHTLFKRDVSYHDSGALSIGPLVFGAQPNTGKILWTNPKKRCFRPSDFSCFPVCQFADDQNSGPLYPIAGTISSRSDDGSSPAISLLQSFNYFGQPYSQIYVNHNGHLTFDAPWSSFSPQQFPMYGTRDIIAPFWTDLDNRANGDIYYVQYTSGSLLQQVTQDINRYFSALNFQANWIFIATWYEVAYFPTTGTVSGLIQRNSAVGILTTIVTLIVSLLMTRILTLFV